MVESDSALYHSIGSPSRIISGADLGILPAFLRFNSVDLWFGQSKIMQQFQTKVFSPQPSIEEKCEQFDKYLQMLKPALIGTKLFVWADIDLSRKDCDSFSSHSQLLDYLRDRLLPICNLSAHYTFNIHSYSKASDLISAKTALHPFFNHGRIHQQFINQHFQQTTLQFCHDSIALILQTPEINRCSDVTIKFSGICYPTQLPVKTISDWLNQNPNEMEINRRCNGKQDERILHIESIGGKFQNALEIFEHLKKVGVSFW